MMRKYLTKRKMVKRMRRILNFLTRRKKKRRRMTVIQKKKALRKRKRYSLILNAIRLKNNIKDPLEQAVNNLVSELKHKDEFNTFREAFYQFKANNADALAQLTAQLSSRRLDYLRDILLAHRVVTEGKVIIRKMLIPQNIKAPSHFSD